MHGSRIKRSNKSNAIRNLNKLVHHETTLRVKQSKLEQNNFELKSAEQTFLEQLQQINLRFKRHLLIIEKKQLEDEFDFHRQNFNQFEERDWKLNSEIKRLRSHLFEMEESCTKDRIAAEDQEKS